jgi:hypothetical protein
MLETAEFIGAGEQCQHGTFDQFDSEILKQLATKSPKLRLTTIGSELNFTKQGR